MARRLWLLFIPCLMPQPDRLLVYGCNPATNAASQGPGCCSNLSENALKDVTVQAHCSVHHQQCLHLVLCSICGPYLTGSLLSALQSLSHRPVQLNVTNMSSQPCWCLKPGFMLVTLILHVQDSWPISADDGLTIQACMMVSVHVQCRPPAPGGRCPGGRAAGHCQMSTLASTAWLRCTPRPTRWLTR